MPIFVLMVAAITDFGWLFFQRAAVDAAVGDGCRAGAIIDPMLGDPAATAVAKMRAAVVANGLLCGDDCITTSNQLGSVPNKLLVCSLSLTYEPLFGLLTDSMTLEAETVARFEWQREDLDTGL